MICTILQDVLGTFVMKLLFWDFHTPWNLLLKRLYNLLQCLDFNFTGSWIRVVCESKIALLKIWDTKATAYATTFAVVNSNYAYLKKRINRRGLFRFVFRFICIRRAFSLLICRVFIYFWWMMEMEKKKPAQVFAWLY